LVASRFFTSASRSSLPNLSAEMPPATYVRTAQQRGSKHACQISNAIVGPTALRQSCRSQSGVRIWPMRHTEASQSKHKKSASNHTGNISPAIRPCHLLPTQHQLCIQNLHSNCITDCMVKSATPHLQSLPCHQSATQAPPLYSHSFPALCQPQMHHSHQQQQHLLLLQQQSP
jgi:hypothetical protein